MLRFVRSCLQFLLKLVNSVIGLMGMGMTLYSLWMLRVWYKQVHSFWTSGPDSTLPWFIYTCLGLGVYFCIISCAGHISAETANGCCLSSYIVFVLLLVMMEAAISADVLLNKVWEKDFPEDPTGRFDELKKFVISNYELCKWIALVVVSAQVNYLLKQMFVPFLKLHLCENCSYITVLELVLVLCIPYINFNPILLSR
ncbi:Tetraspanin-19 [Dendrobium catenatum]|uniref:Tetraspanin-19 n=1 Tax=Dendrobium catenatum TaxID=906689 RepID=A0A2I0VMZ1_9ASPA|nr:Tetraspanin-19 [Dendrobium catenatum]